MKKRILVVLMSVCMIISCMTGITFTAGAEPSPVTYYDEDGSEKSCIIFTGITEDISSMCS